MDWSHPISLRKTLLPTLLARILCPLTKTNVSGSLRFLTLFWGHEEQSPPVYPSWGLLKNVQKVLRWQRAGKKKGIWPFPEIARLNLAPQECRHCIHPDANIIICQLDTLHNATRGLYCLLLPTYSCDGFSSDLFFKDNSKIFRWAALQSPMKWKYQRDYNFLSGL